MKFTIVALFLSLWISTAFAGSCSELLISIWKSRQETYITTTAIEKYLKELVDDPQFYFNYKNKFSKILNTFPHEDAEKINAVLESMRYIDYEDHASDLIDLYFDGSRLLQHSLIPKLYNDGDYDYFRQLSNTKEWIRAHQRKIDIDFITDAHSKTMVNSHDLARDQIGIIRSVDVYGDESYRGLTRAQIDTVNKNPFISFDTPANSVGRTKGNIDYVNVNNIKDEAIEVIHPYYPELAERLLKTRGTYSEGVIKDRTNRELITALTNSVLNNFYAKSELIGELNSVETYRSYIESVALVYRDLISIHPLTDGNGRTLREAILYNLLDSRGIARPRLSNPSYDYLFTPAEWVLEVEQGIVSSHRLYKDMLERIELGLRLDNSPELIYPGIPRNVRIPEAYQGSYKLTEDAHLMFIDSRQFGAYLDTRVTISPNLEQDLFYNPLEEMEKISQEFVEFSKKHRMVFNYTKNSRAGEARGIGINLVDRDFYWDIGYNYSSSKAAWDNKIKRYYTNQTVWRGLPYEEIPDENYIRSLFFEVSDHNASMRILSEWDQQMTTEQVLEMARDDFVSFNKDVVGNTITKMAQDHHTEGELYEQSIYISTSFKHGTAVGFSKGSHQGYQSVGVVVGMKQPRASLEVNHLRYFDPDFRAKYPRQDEVLIPGIVDPDSVMFVQTVDSKGKILKTYYRNPENPSEILVVSGDYRG